MRPTDVQLLSILRIAHDTSLRGAGLSIRDALRQTDYVALRVTFGPGELLPLINCRPDLMEDWLLFSADKRTNGGWYLTEEGAIGAPGASEEVRFDTLEVAVAEYVVRELDHWVSVGRRVEKSHQTGGAG